MTARTVWLALVAVLAVGGCGSHPTVASSRSGMGAAVRAATAALGGAERPVRWELHPRCGPADEVLDGRVLHAVGPSIAVPARGAALRQATEVLTDQGLAVEQRSDGRVLLRATPDDGSWHLIVTGGTQDSELAVRASGMVDDSDADGVEVVHACG